MQNIATGALGLIPVGILLTVRDHVYVLLKHPGVDLSNSGVTVDSINLWTYRALLFILAIAVLSLLGEIAKASWQAYRGRGVW
jgi:hypothetical protein